MAVLRTLVLLAATAMLFQFAIAANYTVGGSSGGWDSSTDLQTWVASQKFSVGDNLIFQYTPNHDVLEVSKADYDSCQTSNPIKTYNDGNTAIPLTAPGKRYFICGTSGHCSQGMLLEIDTLATTPSIPATPPSTSPTPPSSSSPSPNSRSPKPSASPAPTSSSPSPQEESPAPAAGSPLSLGGGFSTESPGTSPISPSGVSKNTPSPSSANRNGFLQTCLAMGFGLSLMVLWAL